MKIVKAICACLVALSVFLIGMQVEGYLRESESQLRKAVFAVDGLPGFTDLYTLPETNSRTGIVVDTKTGKVYYCRIDLFGELVKKEYLFEIDHYTEFSLPK